MWYRILFVKNLDFKRRRDVLLPPKRIFRGNLLTRCYGILKLDKMRRFKRSEKSAELTQCTHTHSNNFTFTAGFDQQTTDFNTKSSNLHAAVSQMRAVVLVHDKIQANCKET